MRSHLLRAAVLAPLAAAAACSSSSSPETPPATDAGPDGAQIDAGDPYDFALAPVSCAYQCPETTCPELTAPYACPSLGAWDAIPHDPSACAAWDGTFPAVVQGQCTASAPSGDGARYAGRDPNDPAAYFLPDGRRIKASGAEFVFADTDLDGGFTSKILAIPGTSLAVTVDTGDGTHVVRLVDTTKLGTANAAAISRVTFPGTTLNSGLAFIPPDLVLVAGHGVVQGITIDTAAGTLTRDDTRTISLPMSVDDQSHAAPYHVSAMTLWPDASKLLVTGLFDSRALVYDVTKASFGTMLGSVGIGGGGTYACERDPNDAATTHVYCSMWQNQGVLEIDVSTPAAPKVGRTFAVDKTPTGIVALDGRWLAVSNDLGDTISIIDRTSGTVTPVPVDATTPLRGTDPTRVAYDPTAKRLYATLAASNAVTAWDVDLTQTPPRLTPSGMLPTSWWPEDLTLLSDGSLLVANARGHSNGPDPVQYPTSHGYVTGGLMGSVEHIPAPAPTDLTAGEAAVTANNAISQRAGEPAVTCPGGANDFPIPQTNTAGASPVIKHVLFIVRENKTFDAILGDLPGVEGAANLTMKTSSADMDKLWMNFRNLARTFSISDDYYTDSEISDQGHMWTFYGRTDEFTERSWMIFGNVYTTPIPQAGFAPHSIPVEGSVLDWLGNHGVKTTSLGEGLAIHSQIIDGNNPVDIHYPGGFVQVINHPDVERACYFAGRERVTCDLQQFVYQTLPNDHGSGVDPSTPSPELMVAMNDEATGMVVDAVSHSPNWKDTLIIVTEDDPANGGDHVEHHRVPILFVSPWVKRGYVSKTHIDVSSVHKIFAHVFGIPYSSREVANAAIPYDLFTSTPDYTQYTYKPRVWPASCGKDGTLAERYLTKSFDLRDVDRQPELDEQMFRYMRGEQWTTLPPDVEMKAARRMTSQAMEENTAEAEDPDD